MHTITQNSNGLRALAKLIAYGRNNSYFSAAEQLIVEGTVPDILLEAKEEQAKVEGILIKKPNRQRKLRSRGSSRLRDMAGGKFRFKSKK